MREGGAGAAPEQGGPRTISACFTVRGKPSRRKPFLQGGESRLLSISSTTISSLTCRQETGVLSGRRPRIYTQLPPSCMWGDFWGCSVQGQGLGSIIFVCPFRLRIFRDFMIHVNDQAACSDLPTSGQHSLQHQNMGNATFHSRDTPARAGTWTSTVTSLLQRLLYCREHCQLKLLGLLFFF